MVGSFSTSGDVGGTLHLPSPTHIHHVDPASAFRQLRHSLSRSPSKGLSRTPSLTRTPSKFRLVTSKSTSPSPSSPLSPSQQASTLRSTSASVLSPGPAPVPSPLAVPYPHSARKIRPAARKLSPMRHPSRSNSTQRSPKKRTLNESTSNGNATPRSSASSSDDQENRMERSVSPMGEPMTDVVFKPCAPQEETSPFAPARATAKFEKGNSWSAKSSPLKRSDGIMNLDQANLGSPSRKRRSLHAGIFSSDFNIFDHEAALGDDSSDLTESAVEVDKSNRSDLSAVLPKRTSSLRKTTLQQRHDKPSFVRSRPNTDLASDFATPSQGALKNRFRMSLDSVIPSMPRDSPFSSQGSLPNASAHPLSQQGIKQNSSINTSHPQRHPLSRTISQSTSNSSMAEDSPTHIPFRQPEKRRTLVDFSKSLPVGAPRPGSRNVDSSSQASSGASFATPENYKLVKPLPAAFMSTGLISKRHKQIDEPQNSFGASKSSMPDTPCKRHSLAEIPSPKVPYEETFTKSHQTRHSFGTPSSPFSLHTRQTPGSFGKGVSIFGSNFGNGSNPRRGSFISADGDDQLQSSPMHGDSQSSAEFEFPPTPTKQVNTLDSVQQTPFGTSTSQKHLTSQGLGTPGAVASDSGWKEPNCKFLPVGVWPRGADGECDGFTDHSPLAALGFRPFSSMTHSFTHSRLLRNSRSPTPLSRASFSASAILSQRSQAKRSPLSPASPINDRSQHLSPHTPRESMMPPDPSSLSISAHGNENVCPSTALTSSASIYPPATPTASRDSLSLFNKSIASITPSHTSVPIDVAPVLTSRFDKVDLIGAGEFSQVYKVTRKQELKPKRSYFSLPLGRASPKTPLPDQVWAVKKSRNAYIGPKDRQRKLQEVNTLKALGQSDHTLQLFDSWENKNHLYIQTEFCEEGSLSVFLDQVGRKARLDDFRIWKIMLELSLVSIDRARFMLDVMLID